MRALRHSFQYSGWLRTLVAALVVLSLAVAGPAFADEADEDDFLSDDFLEDDEDDFLSDDFAEVAEELVVQEKGAYYWAFEVPIDVLLLRPAGALDITVGGMFVALIAVPLVVGASFGAITDAIQGEGWYYDTTNLEAALEQAVVSPSEFLFDRPLGQLVSY